MDGKLHIGPSGIHTDFPHDIDGCRSHDLVFPVAEGLGRGNGNAVSGMNSHWIHVFNGADNHHIVIVISHHLQFVLFPAQHRLLQHDLMGEAGIQPGFCDFRKIVGVVGHTAAGPTHGIAGTYDDRVSDLVCNGPYFVHGVCKPAVWNTEPDPFHGFTEPVSFFRLFNGIDGSTDDFHTVLFRHSHLRDFNGGVESGLAAQCGKKRIRTFLFNDFCNGFRSDGLNVGAVRHLGIRHDGGRITVDQNNVVAFFFKRFARLCA